MKNNILEALLYVQGDEGLDLEQVKETFSLRNKAEAKKVMNDFIKDYNARNGGLKVVEFNEIYKLATRETYKENIQKMVQVVKKHRLSNAAIEVAGIIAYKQPLTRGMINKIRGVASDQVLNTLLTKGVVREAGVSPTPGKPVLYEVTNKFFDYFKIKSLNELPRMTEFNFIDVEEETNEEFNLFDSQRSENNV
ncbi:SMC-Scp complex subunit ScpB [Mycoplasmopsis iners]|uniref:SMC-Scp complex subunit ScpB n=1 Tax=Mycoplasmopsis iners TaxID=76630 RepID=UPI000497897B|nr:SMC-Scp complex subunit ScpB [Mycoplasmopsis iners]